MFGWETLNTLASWGQDGIKYGHNKTRLALNVQHLEEYEKLRKHYSAEASVKAINETFGTSYKKDELEKALKV